MRVGVVMEKIRVRATLYAIAIVLIFISFFSYSIFQDKKRVLEEKTSSHRELLKNTFEFSVSDTEKELNHFAYDMINDHSIIEAFESAVIPHINLPFLFIEFPISFSK